MADARYDGYDEGYEKGITTGREEGISIGLERGIEQGLARGAYEKALKTARNLLSMGLSPEQVAQGTSLPMETVMELVQEK